MEAEDPIDPSMVLYIESIADAICAAADTMAGETLLEAKDVYLSGATAPFNIYRFRSEFKHVGDPTTPEKMAMNLDQFCELACRLFSDGAHFGAKLAMEKMVRDAAECDE